MDLSMTLLLCGAGAILTALLYCLFGYRLAQFILPICGVLFLEGVIYLFIYPLLKLDLLSAWLFFGGIAITIYIVLFFLKRFAGFFTGLLGAGLMLIYVIYAFSLHDMPYLYPAYFTLCVLAGLLTFVYNQMGAVIATSVFGGCLAAFAGVYLISMGIDSTAFETQPNVLIPLVQFLQSHGLLVMGVALVLTAVGGIIQILWSGRVKIWGNTKHNKRDTWIDDGEDDVPNM